MCCGGGGGGRGAHTQHAVVRCVPGRSCRLAEANDRTHAEHSTCCCNPDFYVRRAGGGGCLRSEKVKEWVSKWDIVCVCGGVCGRECGGGGWGGGGSTQSRGVTQRGGGGVTRGRGRGATQHAVARIRRQCSAGAGGLRR